MEFSFSENFVSHSVLFLMTGKILFFSSLTHYHLTKPVWFRPKTVGYCEVSIYFQVIYLFNLSLTAFIFCSSSSEEPACFYFIIVYAPVFLLHFYGVESSMFLRLCCKFQTTTCMFYILLLTATDHESKVEMRWCLYEKIIARKAYIYIVKYIVKYMREREKKRER